jgi:hypothetical protein
VEQPVELCRCEILELWGGCIVTNPTLRGGCWMLGVHPSLSSLATGGFMVLWFGGLLGRFRCGTLVFRGGCKVTKPTLRGCCVDATVSCSSVEVLAVLGFTFEACVWLDVVLAVLTLCEDCRVVKPTLRACWADGGFLSTTVEDTDCVVVEPFKFCVRVVLVWPGARDELGCRVVTARGCAVVETVVIATGLATFVGCTLTKPTLRGACSAVLWLPFWPPVVWSGFTVCLAFDLGAFTVTKFLIDSFSIFGETIRSPLVESKKWKQEHRSLMDLLYSLVIKILI